MLYVKLLILFRFIYCNWKIWTGKSTGVNIRDIFIDFAYFGFFIYLICRFQIFSFDTIYLDFFLIIVIFIYLIELIFMLKSYFVTKDFSLNPENRLIYYVEELIRKNKEEKSFRVLSSHIRIVKYSAPLLIYLGDAYAKRKKFEEAYSCYVDATDYTKDENLLISATTKAFLVCKNELKEMETGKEFVQEQIKKDISLRHITELEKLIQ